MYILVNDIKKEPGQEIVYSNPDDLPRLGLLLIILAVIFMKDNVIAEGKKSLNNYAFLHCILFYVLLYKVQCFIRISGTDKTDDLTCEIISDNFTCENYRFSNNHQS